MSTSSERRAPVRVIAVGNPLMGDDGAGLAVLDLLERDPPPPGVEFLDGGTGGLVLLTLMDGAAAVVLVDAVDAGRAPGEVLLLAADDLPAPEALSAWSAHAPGLAEVLALGRELGPLPAVRIVGIQPAAVAPGLGLSPPVAAALPAAAAAVRRLLAELSEELP